MKLLVVLMGFLSVSSAHSQQFGLSRTATSDLTCTLYRPSGKLPNGLTLYPCVSKAGNYGIGFAGIRIDTATAISQGSSLQIRLHCTVGQPQGAFVYGGETAGYSTSANPPQKFFYAAGEGNYGRCFLSTDKALMSNIRMTVNQSGIALVPSSKAPKAEVAR